MRLYFDPLNKACKSHTGAAPCGSEITFHIYSEQGGEENFSADACFLVLYRDDLEAVEYPMARTEDGFAITLAFHDLGLWFYHFRIGDLFLGCGKLRRGELTQVPNSWQLTVFREDYETPHWMKGGVMYQIFPDRFARSGRLEIAPHKVYRDDWGGTPRYRPNEFGKVLNNDFFGGNFNGIREKLDYLKSLHVSVIYFNPIFEAYSNHRYDTGDYMKIDPLLGTEEEFCLLIKEATERGIRIILDGVFNHTGDDSRYFNKYGRYKEELGAHQSPDSPYSDWYCFREYPDSYESWWGIDTLPAVNEASKSYQEFIFGESGVLRHWLGYGIAGYRLDVADELPDFFLEKLRTSVKTKDPEAVIIGEVWEDASNKVAYDVRRKYLQGAELDSVMNYPLKDAVIHFVRTGSTVQLREAISMLVDNYPKSTLDSLMNVLGTHDTPRILTVFGEHEYATKDEMAEAKLSDEERAHAIEKVKMAAVLQFTLPGVPCIYYGDENGMEGYRDPFCRRCFDWEHLNTALISFYQKLGEIRSGALNAAFAEGEYREIFADNSCLVFERCGKKSAYVFVNNSASKYNLNFDGKYDELIGGKTYCDKLEIVPFSYGILMKK